MLPIISYSITYRSALPVLNLPQHQMTAAEETVASVALVNWIRATVVFVIRASLLLTSLRQRRPKTTVLVMKLPKIKNVLSFRTRYLLFHPVTVFYSCRRRRSDASREMKRASKGHGHWMAKPERDSARHFQPSVKPLVWLNQETKHARRCSRASLR